MFLLGLNLQVQLASPIDERQSSRFLAKVVNQSITLRMKEREKVNRKNTFFFCPEFLYISMSVMQSITL